VVAAALLTMAISRWFLFGVPAFSVQDHDSVLVSDFENHTDDSCFDNAPFDGIYGEPRAVSALPMSLPEPGSCLLSSEWANRALSA
jgi:hypothetical protein